MNKYLLPLVLTASLYTGLQAHDTNIGINIPLGPIELSKQLPFAIDPRIALAAILGIPTAYVAYPYIKFACTSYTKRYEKAKELLEQMRNQYQHCKYWRYASKNAMKQLENNRYWLKKYAHGLRKDLTDHRQLTEQLLAMEQYMSENRTRLIATNPELDESSIFDGFNLPIKIRMPRIQVRI